MSPRRRSPRAPAPSRLAADPWAKRNQPGTAVSHTLVNLTPGTIFLGPDGMCQVAPDGSVVPLPPAPQLETEPECGKLTEEDDASRMERHFHAHAFVAAKVRNAAERAFINGDLVDIDRSLSGEPVKSDPVEPEREHVTLSPADVFVGLGSNYGELTPETLEKVTESDIASFVRDWPGAPAEPDTAEISAKGKLTKEEFDRFLERMFRHDPDEPEP